MSQGVFLKVAGHWKPVIAKGHFKVPGHTWSKFLHIYEKLAGHWHKTVELVAQGNILKNADFSSGLDHWEVEDGPIVPNPLTAIPGGVRVHVNDPTPYASLNLQQKEIARIDPTVAESYLVEVTIKVIVGHPPIPGESYICDIELRGWSKYNGVFLSYAGDGVVKAVSFILNMPATADVNKKMAFTIITYQKGTIIEYTNISVTKITT